MSGQGHQPRPRPDESPRHPAGKAVLLVIVVGMLVVLMAAASTFGH